MLAPAYVGDVTPENRTMGNAVHAHAISAQEGDIDFMGHVNNAVYLNWVQEAVLGHWRRVAGPEAVAAHVWVALRHEITYRKPAFVNDRIVATAVLEKVQREFAFYETVIRRQEDVLAHVKSRWCCLDAITLRPTRLGSEIVERFLPVLDREQASALLASDVVRWTDGTRRRSAKAS
jgi:acyl-CoA thioester hydrolase